jgi:serine/threonine protein phosphatase PrpC
MKFQFEILSATLKGIKPEDTPNQDCLRIEENKDFLIATISDGLGSACKSQIGAQIACDIVVSYFKSNKEIKAEKISDNILSEWKRRIATKPLENQVYSTTNSFVIVLKNEKKVIVGKIGDVFVALKIDSELLSAKSFDKDFLNETEALGTKNQKYSFEIFDYKKTVGFLSENQ